MGASVLPQRQENAGFAAVVARVGGPKCPGMHLPQGSASPWTSATAGKCGFCCRCGKGRRTGVPREASLAGDGQFRGFRNGRKMRVPMPLWQGAEDRGNMERRHFMVIPPEGLLRAASPKPSIRRRAPPGHLQQILPQPRPMSPSARTGKAKSVSATGPG